MKGLGFRVLGLRSAPKSVVRSGEVVLNERLAWSSCSSTEPCRYHEEASEAARR